MNLPAGERRILHVDMDAFYASVEQHDDPSLAGRPVLVGGTGGRGVVAAASYEARRFGCRSAMPMNEAIRRCPEAVCVRPRMDRYREISARVFEVLESHTPLVEGLSLDEAYLDVSAGVSNPKAVEALARTLKAEIRERTGLTASVGAGPNKLVAKIASDLGKPDGLVVLFADAVIRALDPLPARAIGSIGPRSAERLEALGITTIGDLRAAPGQALRQVFGRYAEHMRARASGLDDRPVVPEREDVSVSAEETFDTDVGNRAAMAAHVSRLAETVAARLRKKDLEAGCVVLKVRRADFRTFTRQKRVSPAVASATRLASNALELLDAWLAAHPGAQVRLLGVGAARLTTASQLSLFETDDGRSRAAGRVADDVRARFGTGAIVRARDLD